MGTRFRTCDCCGKQELVRQDNASTTCGSCAARARGAKGNEAKQANRLMTDCLHCRRRFNTTASILSRGRGKYCSAYCHLAAKQVDRTCKHCGVEFKVARSLLSANTNSSANFCSRPCYERWLCNTEKTTDRGSRWKAIRAEVLKRDPFCAICGTTRHLQVHHIVPYRLTQDNGHDNLIPLCTRDHKRVEISTVEIIASGQSPDDLKYFFGGMLRERQTLTRMTLREILREQEKRKAAAAWNGRQDRDDGARVARAL